MIIYWRHTGIFYNDVILISPGRCNNLYVYVVQRKYWQILMGEDFSILFPTKYLKNNTNLRRKIIKKRNRSLRQAKGRIFANSVYKLANLDSNTWQGHWKKNYRPISLININVKLLDSTLSNHIWKYIKIH